MVSIQGKGHVDPGSNGLHSYRVNTLGTGKNPSIHPLVMG